MSDAEQPRLDEETLRRLQATWRSPTGFAGWFSEVNNRPLGVRYMVTAVIFAVIGVLLSLLIRAQLAVSENDLLQPDVFNEIFTMHGSTMMYLFAVPFLEGLALYLIPLMVGSRDVAFPRLTAFGYWLYLFGGLVMFASFAFGRVPDAGWFAYTPLSGPKFAGIGLDFWLLGLGLVEIAGLSAAVEIVVTILKLRAPGMAVHRMPLLIWSFLVAGVMIVFGFTPLLLATLLLELDRAAGMQFFNPEGGGSTLLWQHLFWFFGHPEVYIIFLPATGIISSIIPVAARRPIRAYSVIVAALVITGFVSFGLWMHHMYTTGLPEVSMLFFAAASFMVALASGGQVFAWIATLWGSRPRLTTPMLFILGFFFIFVAGGMTGVMVATMPFDWQVHDSYFIVAHFHYVLIGGAVFPIAAGIHHWLPKVTGRLPSERWGKRGFWLMFIGFNVTFFPMHIMGFFGMPRRVWTYESALGLDAYNLIATIGAAITAAGVAIVLGNLVRGSLRGPAAGDDPWDAGTLEWTVASPPPDYGFRAPMVVRHRYPAWAAGADGEPDEEMERVARALDGRPAGWRATLLTDGVDGRPQALQWLPGPTYVPLAAAGALLAAAVAVLAKGYLTAIAAGVVAIGAIVAWLRQDPGIDREEAAALESRIGLPVEATGARSTGWWATIVLLGILFTALGVLVYVYFYLRLYSEAWPQGGLELPSLLDAAAMAAALGAGAAAQWWASRRWRAGARRPAIVALALVAVTGVAAVVTRVTAIARAPFSPSDNAYASAFYTLNGFALLLIAVGLALAVVSLVDLVRGRRPLEEAPMRLQLQVTELLWFFAVAAGMLAIAVTHLTPHVL